MTQATQAPKYLIPPCIERGDGEGPAIELGALRGKLARITIGINDVLEQEGLAISVWGSPNGTDWGVAPLLSLPRKSYCGDYNAFVNLARHPAVRFLRAEWRMSRWGKRESGLMFGFYVAIDESHSRFTTAVA